MTSDFAARLCPQSKMKPAVVAGLVAVSRRNFLHLPCLLGFNSDARANGSAIACLADQFNEQASFLNDGRLRSGTRTAGRPGC